MRSIKRARCMHSVQCLHGMHACRPDRDRFTRPYVHELCLPTKSSSQPQQTVQLSIKQQKFGPQGFASTGSATCCFIN